MPMEIDNQLKDTLAITVSNAITRLEQLADPRDRRCIFQEYKEWLEQDIENEVWTFSSDWYYQKRK